MSSDYCRVCELVSPPITLLLLDLVRQKALFKIASGFSLYELTIIERPVLGKEAVRRCRTNALRMTSKEEYLIRRC